MTVMAFLELSLFRPTISPIDHHDHDHAHARAHDDDEGRRMKINFAK